MEFSEMREMAGAVRAQYAAMEERRYGRRWTTEEIMLGFVGDVGELTLSDEYGVDLEQAFSETMESLRRYLAESTDA